MRSPQCAFVSTNSIVQGEQVGVLWGWLLQQGVRINFAHRSFSWSNEASGRAAVHCVIIGFAIEDSGVKTIFEYAQPGGAAHAVSARNINPYLVDAPDVLLNRRVAPLCRVPPMNYGSMANDGGHLILTDEVRTRVLEQEPDLGPFIRRFVGGDEFLNDVRRWCLWLKDAPPRVLRSSAILRDRINEVRRYRQASSRAQTVALAATPTLFGEDRQPATRYLLLPKVSSENRPLMPIGFFGAEAIANGSALIVPEADHVAFGVLSSSMHMAWMRAVAGRLESRYQYSIAIVYNNFPWPAAVTDTRPTAAQAATRQAIEVAAQGVLQTRDQFHGATIADLYDPLTMPAPLLRAHQRLDAAVDAAYALEGGRRTWASEADRVAFLFQRYQALAARPVPAQTAAGGRRTRPA